MIWSNRGLKVVEKQLSFGNLKCVVLGESGRGRKEILIPSNYDLKRENPELTIGQTKSGKPRINKGSDPGYDFLHINTYSGYTRRGCGWVQELATDEPGVEVVARGNGADGAAGRIGTWDDIIIKVPIIGTFTFRVRYSGGNPSGVIIVEDGVVTYIKQAENPLDYYDMMDKECPFSISDDRTFNNSEWETL